VTLGQTTLLHPNTTPGLVTLLHPSAAPSPNRAPNFLSQSTRHPFAADSEVDFTAVVAKVAEFGPCAKIDVLSEDGIADVIEMRRFGARQENAVLDFGGVTHDRIGANPRIFSDISPAAHGGTWADVARTDEVSPRFDGRRAFDDDPIAANEKSVVVNLNSPRKGVHLRLQAVRIVGVQQGPSRAACGQGRQTTVLAAGKRREKSGCRRHALPVHGHAMKLCGMKVVFAQAAAW